MVVLLAVPGFFWSIKMIKVLRKIDWYENGTDQEIIEPGEYREGELSQKFLAHFAGTNYIELIEEKKKGKK
jgi:hypothetical protein